MYKNPERKVGPSHPRENSSLGIFSEVKFILYSERVTKFCEISTIDLTVTTGCKSQFQKIFEFKIWKEPMLALYK